MANLCKFDSLGVLGPLVSLAFSPLDAETVGDLSAHPERNYTNLTKRKIEGREDFCAQVKAGVIKTWRDVFASPFKICKQKCLRSCIKNLR